MEEDRTVFKLSIGKATGKSIMCRQDSIRVNLKEIGVNVRNSMNSTLDR